MSRSYYVAGEAMVYVKGPQGSAIASLTELGLAETQVRITLHPIHRGINLDAWGGAEAEVQRMLAYCTVSMSMIQFDHDVLNECSRLSIGGSNEGKLARGGTLMGNGLPRFANGNSFVGLNIASPQGNRPWRFFTAYLADPIGEFPQGTLRSVIPLFWKAIPYTQDPWQAGLGSLNFPLYDHQLDT